MNRFLDNSGLTYYSNKIKEYLTTKFNKVESNIDDINSKVDSDKDELNKKIQANTNDVAKNTADIKVINNNVSTIETKVDANYTELKSDFNSADIRPTGDSIYLNNVEQFVFKDIKAGETVTIPNSGDGSDFLIECFVKTEEGTPLVHRSLNINTSTKDLLEYDDRYVEITDNGAKPKDSVTLKLTLQDKIDEYNIYTTDLIPVELVDSIDNLNSYTLILDETVK